jgi:hypothetical protein
MFWIKKSKPGNTYGYLYLRETVYIRDKRTLKKSPKKVGDRTATAKRGKFSKKRDIYCGKIIEKKIVKYLNFNDYVETILNKRYLEFKINSSFETLLEIFVDFLLYVYDIEKNEYFNDKKKAYYIANGFLCPQTINHIIKFQINGNPDDNKEIERFSNRCKDAGIFDDEVIMSLYVKIMPNVVEDVENEIKELEKINIDKKTSSFEEYMRQEHENLK